MFLLNICIGTCFKENIWVFVDSYSNPHWHWAPPLRLSQLSQYLNILDLGASPVQCCWCCWCCWLLLWVGGVRRWLWKADSVLWTESSPVRPAAQVLSSQSWMGRDAVNISHRSIVSVSTPGDWSQCPLPTAISDPQWPDPALTIEAFRPKLGTFGIKQWPERQQKPWLLLQNKGTFSF